MIDELTYKIDALRREDAIASGDARAEEYYGHPDATLYSVNVLYLNGVYQDLDPHLRFTLKYRGSYRRVVKKDD